MLGSNLKKEKQISNYFGEFGGHRNEGLGLQKPIGGWIEETTRGQFYKASVSPIFSPLQVASKLFWKRK